jgi:hypothetical protein
MMVPGMELAAMQVYGLMGGKQSSGVCAPGKCGEKKRIVVFCLTGAGFFSYLQGFLML